MVRQRETPQYRGARRPETHQNLAPVARTAGSSDIAVLFQAVNQFDRGVMLKLHLRRELADGGLYAGPESADGEQKLVLARLQAMSSRLFLAEVEESANLEAKFSQGAVFGKGKIVHH